MTPQSILNAHGRRLAAGLALLAALAAGACETPLPAPEYADITFQHQPAIKLDVARIEIVEAFVSPLKSPNVEHESPAPPLKLAARWARDRLRAAGANGTARLVIEDAAIVATTLEKKTGLTAALREQAAARYSGSLKARLEVAAPGRKGFAEAAVVRLTTIGERASLNDRERTLYNLSDKLVRDFDAQMERAIAQHLKDWLK